MSNEDYIIYERPLHNKDAIAVWDEAELGAKEYYRAVCEKLWIWAMQEELIYIVDNVHHIRWFSATGTRHEARWAAFVSWMICCCARSDVPGTPGVVGAIRPRGINNLA